MAGLINLVPSVISCSAWLPAWLLWHTPHCDSHRMLLATSALEDRRNSCSARSGRCKERALILKLLRSTCSGNWAYRSLRLDSEPLSREIYRHFHAAQFSLRQGRGIHAFLHKFETMFLIKVWALGVEDKVNCSKPRPRASLLMASIIWLPKPLPVYWGSVNTASILPVDRSR